MGRRKKKVSKVFIIFFIVGALFGIGASYLVTRNDCFVLNGSKEIILEINDTYIEQGVKVVSFGKDISKNTKITIYDINDDKVDSIDTSSENEYTVIYNIENLKYANYKLIRKVKVGGSHE
ncbi:MAG: DUF5011 domain-containing protein [Erysipelotrichaceae bacterium]|nr:DUF5011 domain-containing protein [Erysipelotrichaceae bacterium]